MSLAKFVSASMNAVYVLSLVLMVASFKMMGF